MCKKLVMLCLALGLASAAYAYDVQLGDFETGTDGWTNMNSWGSNADANLYAPVTTGVTQGSGALEVEVNVGWGWAATVNVSVSDFMAASTLELDVTRLTSEWIEDPCASGMWNGWKLQWNSDGFGGQYDMGDDNTWWSAANGDGPMHAVWDLTDAQGVFDGGAATYLQACFVANSSGYLAGTRPSYYLDDVVLTGVPEPTTIALLGLGSLALIRRKK